tara:strand:+ start:1497 stop:3734 length:2238 start_codon:yes stop_codon:yes gene_type:complete
MNTSKLIDKIVKEWSYVVPNGMPDINNDYHLVMLEDTMRELRIPAEAVKEIFRILRTEEPKKNDKDKSFPAIKLKTGNVSSFDTDDARKNAINKGTHAEVGSPEAKEAQAQAGENGKDQDVETPEEKKAAKEKAKEEAKAKELGDKIKEKLRQVPWDPKEDQAKFESALDKLLSGEELTDEELAILNKYARIKDSDGEVAIYLSTGIPGEDDFRQGRRVKVTINNAKEAKAIKKKMLAAGMKLGDATTSKVGSVKPKVPNGVMTLTKLAKSKHGGGIQTHPVKRVPEKGTPVQEVTIGVTPPGPVRKLKRLPEPTFSQMITEGVKAFLEIRNNPKYDHLTDEQVEHLAKKRLVTIRRNNAMVDSYADKDEVEIAVLVPKDENGDPDPSTPEGRAEIARRGPKVLAAALREHMLQYGPLTEAEEEMLKRLDALGDIEDPEEYEKEAMQLLIDMQEVESMRKGVPNIAESVIMCVMNKRGFDCVAPAGETYKVADLIVFPPEDNPDDPNATEYIVWLESAGGLSVKWKGGAASGARAKIEVTVFKNEDTQANLLEIVDLHNNFMATTRPPQPLDSKRIAAGKKKLDEHEKWARAQDPPLLRDEDYDENGDLIVPGSNPQRSTREYAEDSVALWQAKGSLPPDCTPELVKAGESCLTADNKKLLIDGMEQYVRGGIMLEHIHNRDLDFQPYGNANGTADGLELSNGIDCINEMGFTPNPGFTFTTDSNGNHVVRPNSVYAGKLKKVCR